MSLDIDELRCWYTPVFKGQLQGYNHQMQNDVMQEVSRLMSLEGGRDLSNIGGWQSNARPVGDNQVFDRLLFLLNDYINHVSSYMETKMVLNNYWINVNNTDNWNQSHCHPKSLYSGVIYLDATEDQGDIKLFAPFINSYVYTNQSIGFDNYTAKLLGDVDISPSTVTVILFPSFVYHAVNPNKSNKSRISLAFNLWHDVGKSKIS